MDQNSPKNNPDGAKASWRNKLGITDKLPKIADEFHASNEDAATSPEPREAPPTTAAPPRPGTPIARPAPMAPRTPAGSPPAMDFGERIRQQREAAERMAEQRVAEAKERAAQERNAASPSFLSTGTQNVQKPRFTFADEELKQAQQDTVSQAAVGGRQSRPIFTAERPQRPVEASPAQAVYFRLEHSGTAWDGIRAERSLAIQIPRAVWQDFKQLEVTLIAIHRAQQPGNPAR